MAVTIAHKREHRIVVRPEPFGSGADVVVEPAFHTGANFDASQRSIRAAQVYAATLGRRLGMPVIDLTT